MVKEISNSRAQYDETNTMQTIINAKRPDQTILNVIKLKTTGFHYNRYDYIVLIILSPGQGKHIW